MEARIIGRGTWLDKLAYEIIEREKRQGRSLDLIRVESGLGASGIPHIGSLGDAVRAYGVKLALENLGYRSELIAYSDDMDGLRKVPHGLPEWLNDYIAKPVSSIPDPFNCHDSYGMHMSSMLLDALDRLDIKYRFQRGIDTYKQGLMINEIDTILKNASLIGAKIEELVSQDKFKNILPYFPVCKNCKRIYVAEAYKYIEDEKKVMYRCTGTTIRNRFIEGCNYEGEADIRRDDGKLSWKVEFASRWRRFDVRFEAYGKDIADSVKVNDWISDNILHYPHPMHVKYEMFLDKGGKKISKSAGNVFTPQVWLRYGSPQSLLLLLYKRIAGTRNISIEDIPKLMDEYDMLEEHYFSNKSNDMKSIKMRGLYEYINNLKVRSASIHIPYQLLINLASLVKEDREEFVIKRLQKYGMIKEVNEELKNRIRLASNWADDFGVKRELNISLNENEINAIKGLINVLKNENDIKIIQSSIFDIAKSNNIEPKEFFRIIYNILLGSDKGPRLGNYISDMGKEKVIRELESISS
ncbi:MAG: lysine--tRNA ligase [Candidatus Nitrosocaldaceae archaeon]